MRTRLALVAASVLVLTVGGLARGREQAARRGAAAPPAWAYGFRTPPGGTDAPPPAAPAAAPAADETRYTAAGSTLSFTRAEIRDQFGPADWFPGDHPAMPDVVAHGRRDQQVAACSLCHYPNGKGRPENAGVAGLGADYFVQTMRDFRSGRRRSADARKTNTNRMIGFAKAMTDEEIAAAAGYFSSMPWTPWIKVVEAAAVPKTRIAGGMFIALEGAEAGTEPIGRRIVEVPANAEQTEALRNPRSGFVAYVPPGSIGQGEALARTGQCALCHGVDLDGIGPVPGLAGRSPSYIVRQLYDMQQGARAGVWAELMTPVVARLSVDDMLALAAYTASRPPRGR
jgi:cytochrome c553